MQDFVVGSQSGCLAEKVSCMLSDCYGFWEQQLTDDVDRDYLLDGVLHGFDILEGKQPPLNANMRNYNSVLTHDFSKAEKQIAHEIECGNYRVVQTPQVISSLGAVAKPNGSIRLIHDLSRPLGGVNAFVADSSCSHNTVDFATNLMSDGCFLSKVDLKAAYRSVPICPRNFAYTGLKWTFRNDTNCTYLVDTKLPFGAKKACKIFSRLSDAVARLLKKQEVQLVNYVDDLLIISKSRVENWLDLDKTINMLTKLGFEINWSKVEPPSQNISFLGVQIDTISRTLSLPESKLKQIKDLVCVWSLKKRASKKELQRFLGKLNWAARVVRGGRTFMRRLIDLMSKLKKSNHRTWLNLGARSDILWWAKGLEIFHGYSKFVSDLHPPTYSLATDSCRAGGGAVHGDDWVYSNFAADYPDIVNEHINTLELFVILLAARRWGHLWCGTHVQVKCDNLSAVYAINKGCSRSPIFMRLLREVFWLSERYQFRLTAVHISGVRNIVADTVSRLHLPDFRQKFVEMFSWRNNFINCASHMSFSSFLCLQGLSST